jgi:hypothetical protein
VPLTPTLIRKETPLAPQHCLDRPESVQPASLELLAPEYFRVMVFVGATQSKLSVDLATAMQKMGERAEYIRIAGVGKNALDFHIAYYIGRIAAVQPDSFFQIISKDTGFEPLVQHLGDQKIFCGRWACLEDIPVVKAAQVTSPEERAVLFMSSLLQPNATRPRTEKRLRNAIAARFQRQLTEEEIGSVVTALQRPGQISITDGKVVYAAAA